MTHGHQEPDAADRGLALKALSLLRRVGAATHEWHRTNLNEGFTVNQALVLHHLVIHGDATPSGLSEWMHITRGSVTPTIKRLEDLGLLTRRADEEDGRKQWLSATAEAHEIAPEVEETVLRPVLQEFRTWTPEELRGFTAALEKLLAGPVFGGRA